MIRKTGPDNLSSFSAKLFVAFHGLMLLFLFPVRPGFAAGPVYYQYDMADIIWIAGRPGHPDTIRYKSEFIFLSKESAITNGCIRLGKVSRTPYVGEYLKWSYYDGPYYKFYRCHYQNLNPANAADKEIILSGITGFYAILHDIRSHFVHPSCRGAGGRDYYFDVEKQLCVIGNPNPGSVSKKELGSCSEGLSPLISER